MKIAVLLCLPAWCHGEHGFPRPSLVQVSSRGTAHAKAVADSMSSTLAGFQKFTDDLVDQYKKQEPQSESYTSLGDETGMENHSTTKDEMGEDTRQAIEKVLVYIDNFFDDAVIAHGIAAATLQACEERVCANQCNMDESEGLIKTEIERLESQRNQIQACLTEATLKEEEVTKGCIAWDKFRMAEENELPDCVYRPDDDADEFCKQVKFEIGFEFEKGDLCDNKIKADENEDFDQLEVMEDCLEDMHDWLTSTRAKKANCTRVGGKSLSCQSDVEAYHAYHCEYVEVLDGKCDEFDLCIQRCNEDCGQAQCDDIVILSKLRMADNETGERIKCLLKTLLNETVINKTEGLDACTNEIAASRYETWAAYFELTCQASADTPSYPQEVPCAERDQAVSPSTEYVTNLMELVPELKEADQSNPCATHAHWNSCAGGHLCLAGSGAACAENRIDETGSGAVCAEKWTDERCEDGASKEKDCINVG